MKYKPVIKAISDYDCGEFHLTPVITLAWISKKHKKELSHLRQGNVIALEWGFWAIYLGYFKYESKPSI